MYAIKQNIPIDLPKVPFTKGLGKYEGVVAHATAMWEDSDEGESSYFKRDWKRAGVFVHYFVDYNSITQTAELNYRAWGAGGKSNKIHIHVELCQTKNKDKFIESYKRYTWLLAKILFDKKLGVEFGKTFFTHDWITKNWGGTHTDPVGYLQYWNISIEQLIKDIKNEYFKMEKEVIQEVITMLFKDEKDISSWAKDSVKRISDLGFIKGNDLGEFKPKNGITREELAVVLDRVLKYLGK
jgi:N-acetylmuramoyl-L-alanine amidase CwlA